MKRMQKSVFSVLFVVWADQQTWEEIRANKFRPWGPRESTSQVLSQLMPVPMFPVPSSSSSSGESVVATVVVSPASQEFSQPLFSQQSPPEQSLSLSRLHPRLRLSLWFRLGRLLLCSFFCLSSLHRPVPVSGGVFAMNWRVIWTLVPLFMMSLWTVGLLNSTALLSTITESLCATFRGGDWVGASLICRHLSLSMLQCFLYVLRMPVFWRCNVFVCGECLFICVCPLCVPSWHNFLEDLFVFCLF